MFWHPTFNKQYIDNLKQHGLIIVVCGKRVYDFTEYLKNHIHPGSNAIIEEFSNKGKDCSQDYEFHRCEARKIWNKYFIGYLET